MDMWEFFSENPHFRLLRYESMNGGIRVFYVIEFKKTLVKAFFEARALLQTDYFALVKQREALNAKLECEKEIASSCGKGLVTWKKQRDCLTAAIANVDRQIQPCLFD